jgi:preprotein translocase subunit SecY
MVGRRVYGGTSTYIPMKVNMAGVIPVIFAASLIALPALAAQFAVKPDGTGPAWATWVQTYFVRGDHPLYMVAYTLLILFFTFFYVSITFNPTEVADNMKKYGGFIPGIRAGRPTAEYLQYVLTRITVPGAIYLALISLIPLIALVLVGANQNFPFGGTSILIIVGVGLETVKQIESQLQQRHYEGFLR